MVEWNGPCTIQFQYWGSNGTENSLKDFRRDLDHPSLAKDVLTSDPKSVILMSYADP
jgi:hypothetical protein